MRNVWTPIAFLLLSSCYPPPEPVAMRHQFDPDEYIPYTKLGGAAIIGQAFMRQKGGGVVTCAGSPVLLVPDTPYIEEMFSILSSGRQVAGSPVNDPRLK